MSVLEKKNSDQVDNSCIDDCSLIFDQISTFSQVGKALTSTHDLKEILAIVMEQVKDLLRPANWSLLLLDEESQELYFEVVVGEASKKLKDLRFKLGEGIAGWVAKEGKPELVRDVSKDKRFSKRADKISDFTTKSIICVPMKTKDRCYGVIELINTVEEKSFGEKDLLLLTTVADYTAIALENALYFEKIQELTITDDLTGLYNSRYLHSSLAAEVERAKRFDYELSMVFFDLDYFKTVNDKHGHLCGSKMLKEVANLVRHTVRTVDIAYRYGGDEFVVVMPETSKKNARKVADKLRKAFKKTRFLEEEGIGCEMTASFGVASYPDDASGENDLIHLADEAMYRVKKRSRDGIEVA